MSILPARRGNDRPGTHLFIRCGLAGLLVPAHDIHIASHAARRLGSCDPLLRMGPRCGLAPLPAVHAGVGRVCNPGGRVPRRRRRQDQQAHDRLDHAVALQLSVRIGDGARGREPRREP